MNPDDKRAPLHNTFQADVAALLADARLLRTYAVERGKLPDDGFHGEFVQTSNQLAEYSAGPQWPDATTLAALEKRFLVLYNKLASAVAPVTAESIRYSQAARSRRFFWPTVLTVSASILVFLAVVLLQGYWVMGKRLRDLIQRQDLARQELVIKSFTMEDTIAQLDERLNAGGDCEAPPETLAVSRKKESPNVEQVRKCAVREALKEERFKSVYAKRPVVRETSSLQSQVEPAITVLSGWFQFTASLFGGAQWDAPFTEQITTIKNEVAKKQASYNKLLVPPSPNQPPGLESRRSPDTVGTTTPLQQWLLTSYRTERARTEFTRAQSDANAQIADIEFRKWRALSHRIDIALDVVQSYTLPALLGLLGALVFVLRDIAVRLRTSTYIPDSASNGVVRIVVGAMAGVLGGWFIPASDSVAKSIPPLVIPFLFGYSVDILFGLLDKAVMAMSSRDSGAPPRLS